MEGWGTEVIILNMFGLLGSLFVVCNTDIPKWARIFWGFLAVANLYFVIEALK